MNIEKGIMKWGKIKTEINKTCCIRKKPKVIIRNYLIFLVIIRNYFGLENLFFEANEGAFLFKHGDFSLF